MFFAISTAMPDHAPVAMSLLKYGDSPGSAATRSTFVCLTRSKVDSVLCADASWARATVVAASAPPIAAWLMKRLLISIRSGSCVMPSLIMGDADPSHGFFVHLHAETGSGRH